MTTVLQYLVIAGVIGLVVFALAVFVFGRGEQLAPLSARVSPTELPDRDMTADDVRRVRFAMALRGYRMSDVDWALEQLAGELDRLRGEIRALSGDSSIDGQPPGDHPEADMTSSRVSDDAHGPPGALAEQETGSVLTAVARDAGRHLRSDSDETRDEEQ